MYRLKTSQTAVLMRLKQTGTQRVRQFSPDRENMACLNRLKVIEWAGGKNGRLPAEQMPRTIRNG